MTNSGYVKIVPVDFYKSQKRGGKGRSGMTTKEDDFVEKVLTVNSHDIVLFFTNKGIVHQIKFINYQRDHLNLREGLL